LETSQNGIPLPALAARPDQTRVVARRKCTEMTELPFPTASLMNITARPDVVFVKGEGSWLWDHNGKRYLDFVQGWAVNCLGHSPPAVAEALGKQARTLLTPSPAYYNAVSLELAQRLAALSGLDQVFFTNSGAEAIEGAIKLARRWGQKNKGGAHEIITFRDAFHGRTLAAMSASGKAAFELLFEPKVKGFPKAVLNDLASVEHLIGPSTVAVMLEPIQGEAGVLPAHDAFLRELRVLTEKRGLLLILDEIQTGIGRTGRLFHYQDVGIEPDILVLAKQLGGGVPIGALVASAKASVFEHGDQGGTYNGNPLMCAAALAVLDVVAKPQFLDRVKATSALLAETLLGLSTKHRLGSVRGRGLLLALDLGKPISAAVAAAALEAGLLVNAPRPEALRFMPALTVTRGEITEMAAILDRVLARMK
jgi:acetylornithine/N-succinyldiaminopimelate aminotransferase